MMALVKNISDGPRGAYNGGMLVMANPGEVIEADDFAPEWFASDGAHADPLDHDGDGRKGGSKRGRPRKVELEGDVEPEGE